VYKKPMLVRIALWVLGAVDVVVFAWQAVTERQQHPNLLQERLDHQVLVVGASALLLAQIVAVGLALNRRSSGSSGVRNAAAAVVLSGAALFNAASLFVLGLQIWDWGDPRFEHRPGSLAMIAVWVPANVAAFIAAWRCRPWSTSPLARTAFGRMLRKAAVSVLVVMCLAVAWMKFVGVHFETTHLAFVRETESPLFVVTPKEMHVQFEVTPSKDPSEAGWIYLAAKYGMPVVVTVPFEGRKTSFRITGLSPRGDFVVPCDSKAECAKILLANRFDLPPELSAAK
jgi:hypothetical protein